MFSSKDIFLKSSGGGGYQISRSVRLRASATAYFNRTPASATNRTTWTWSGWVKRGSAGGPNVFTLFFAESGGNTNARIEYLASGQFRWFYQLAGVDIAYTLSNALYRDYSAWYHVVYVYDSTQATAANRQILYVNGVQTTNASVITPAQNTVTSINNTVTHWLGKNNSPEYFDGYMTEINFIDGQALTPSSFGETNAVTGVWQPKAYTGTYGTNGFYLNFSDNSNNTAATIGKDSSGNGNNWTPNNISVTSGVTYDSMVDSPTVGATSSNYCTLNPLRYGTGASSTSTVSEANLKFNSSGNAGTIIGTMAIPSTGKWYWEVVVPTQTYNYCMVGVISNQEALSSLAGGVGYLSTGYGVYSVNGQKYNNSSASAYMASTAQNTVITVAFDADTGSLYVGAGGSWANGTGSTNQTWDNAVAAFTSLTGTITPATSFDTGFFNINFGQRPFAYTPPTGFVALNTQNLPTPTISNGANYMAASLWTGNGTSQTIANTVNGIGMQPDLIWSKGRSGASNNSLVDSVRGITLQLSSNLTAADVTDATEITAITSTGFSVGNSSGAGYSTNANGTTYVGWQWKKGATQGFDIVTYTGNYNGTSGTQTIAHSLGVAPKMIIVKNRSSAFDWGVGHASIGWSQAGNLNLTNSFGASSYFNSTAPTSSVFSVGASNVSNQNASTHIAYLFSEVAGYSRFGSYTGNGSTDGPFVYLGFRPRFILFKSSTYVGSFWNILDTSRDTYNAAQNRLYPNSSAAEQTGTLVDILSNGFKVKSANSDFNQSGETYIYAAFAENPFKISLAR